MAFYLWHTEIKSIYSICGTHLCFPVYVTYYFTAYNILSILHSVTPVFSTPCRAIKNNDISNTSMQKRCINYLSYKSCSSQPNILAPPPNCNGFHGNASKLSWPPRALWRRGRRAPFSSLRTPPARATPLSDLFCWSMRRKPCTSSRDK